MKKTILLFLGFGLVATLANAQTKEEVQKYMMQVACECGSKAYTSAVPVETREVAKKIAALSSEELTPYMESLGQEAIVKHMANLDLMSAELDAKCGDADMKAKVLKKYPKAASIMDDLSANADPDETMALIAEISQCQFLQESLAAIMALGMYSASFDIEEEDNSNGGGTDGDDD